MWKYENMCNIMAMKIMKWKWKYNVSNNIK